MTPLPVDRIRFTGETRAAAACRANPFIAAALHAPKSLGLRMSRVSSERCSLVPFS